MIYFQEVLTLEKCVSHLILRGLVRIAIIPQLEKILEYFTIKGYINYGILKITQEKPLPIFRPATVRPNHRQSDACFLLYRVEMNHIFCTHEKSCTSNELQTIQNATLSYDRNGRNGKQT